MAKNVDNLIMGVGSLYIADFGETEPTDVSTEPAAGWTDVGFTQDGVDFSFALEYEELDVDQIVDVPGRRLTKRETTLSTNLAEPTLENLNLVLGGAGTLTTGAGEDEWELNTSQDNVPTYKALLFDGFAPGGFRRRIIVRKALQVGDVEFSYAKDGQSVFSVEFHAHYVSDSVGLIYIADATA